MKLLFSGIGAGSRGPACRGIVLSDHGAYRAAECVSSNGRLVLLVRDCTILPSHYYYFFYVYYTVRTAIHYVPEDCAALVAATPWESVGSAACMLDLWEHGGNFLENWQLPLLFGGLSAVTVVLLSFIDLHSCSLLNHK